MSDRLLAPHLEVFYPCYSAPTTVACTYHRKRNSKMPSNSNIRYYLITTKWISIVEKIEHPYWWLFVFRLMSDKVFINVICVYVR